MLRHHARVTRGRLEAFRDAVIAIVMTIMVLELVPPHAPTLEANAIALAWIVPAVSVALYMLVAAIWIVPDPRIERRIAA